MHYSRNIPNIKSLLLVHVKLMVHAWNIRIHKRLTKSKDPLKGATSNFIIIII